jgi:hypothetical protein
VGVGNEAPLDCDEVPVALERDMIRINCEGTCGMQRTLLPIMKAQEKQKHGRKGAIINISSASGTHPSPMLAVYSATKAFITQYSASTSYEAEEYGIDILLVHPYYISSTGLYQAKKANLNAPSADRIVADTFGYFFPTIMMDTLVSLSLCPPSFPPSFLPYSNHGPLLPPPSKLKNLPRVVVTSSPSRSNKPRPRALFYTRPATVHPSYPIGNRPA